MIIGGLCHEAYLNILMGVHNPKDRYMIALYTAAANINHTTMSYVTQNEVHGLGYEAGGILLEGYEAKLKKKPGGAVAYLDWDDPEWTKCTIKARCALVYNASKDNKALCVLDFGREYASDNGTFLVVLPEPGDTACVSIGD